VETLSIPSTHGFQVEEKDFLWVDWSVATHAFRAAYEGSALELIAGDCAAARRKSARI
jgi:hypothetical protein